MTPKAAPLRLVLWRMSLRLAFVVTIALGASYLIDLSMDLIAHLPQAGQSVMMAVVIAGALAIYMVLMATPFVPGIEIGLTLLVLRGAEIAPAVYLATVLGLSMAFLIGCKIPLVRLRSLFLDLRLTRAAGLVADIAPLTSSERLALLEARLPERLRGGRILRLRYLMLAALLNMPGNAILGGGGGLCLLAGLSGLFRPLPLVITIALAVAPVPLLFWISGHAEMPAWLPF